MLQNAPVHIQAIAALVAVAEELEAVLTLLLGSQAIQLELQVAKMHSRNSANSQCPKAGCKQFELFSLSEYACESLPVACPSASGHVV